MSDRLLVMGLLFFSLLTWGMIILWPVLSTGDVQNFMQLLIALVALVAAVLVISQLRQLEANIRGLTYQNLSNAWVEYNWRVTERPELVRFLFSQTEPHSSVERFKVFILAASMIDQFDNWYVQRDLGLFPEGRRGGWQPWNSWEFAVREQLKSALLREMIIKNSRFYHPQLVALAEKVEGTVSDEDGMVGDA